MTIRFVQKGGYYSEGGYTTGLIGRIFNYVSEDGGWAQSVLLKRHKKSGGKLAPIVDLLPEEVNIIDFGCGGFADGYLTKNIIEVTGRPTSILGVDLDEKIVDIVRSGEFTYNKTPDRYIGRPFRKIVNNYADLFFEGDGDFGYNAKDSLINKFGKFYEDGTYIDIVEGDYTNPEFTKKHGGNDLALNVMSLCYVQDKNTAMKNILGSLNEGGILICDAGVFRKEKDQVFVEYDERYVSVGVGPTSYNQMRILNESKFQVWSSIKDVGYELVVKNIL